MVCSPPKPTLVFDSPGRDDRDSRKKGTKKGKGGHGWGDSTYGGKLTENITSGTCRDLLTQTMLRCEQADLPVVLHAHDEIVVEVLVADAEDALRRLLAIMSQVPAWAEGFPIEVEGYTSFRYVKSPPPGALVVKARDRVVIEEVRLPGTSLPPPAPQPPVTTLDNSTTPPSLPARANDQAHNGPVPVPPSPPPPVLPSTVPATTIVLPPAIIDVLEGRAKWGCVQGDCLSVLSSLPLDSVPMVFGSPPYVGARLYLEDDRDLGIARDTDAWVQWMVQVYRACLRVCTGLVAFVVEGQTKNFSYDAAPFLLAAELKRAGICLRKPPIYRRSGIPGSGSKDWLRNDYELIICATRGGQFPWSDPTACGHPPKYKPGGAMSYRTVTGERVNASKGRGTRGKSDGDLQTAEGYKPPKLANPGNVIDCKVGGGRMGHELAHKNEAPFPEELAEFFVKSFCPPGGIVLDPFAGSGTTLAVALRHGRRALGIDLRPSQVDLTHQRIETELAKGANP
jgi:DNA modification methylase